MLLPSPIQATTRPSSVPNSSLHREQVGEQLAGMQQVGQAVDDRHGGEPRQLLDVGLREGADHDAVDVARQHARRVADRLAAAELDVAGGEEERLPPSCRTPTSNETRVRVLLLAKISAIVLPASGRSA